MMELYLRLRHTAFVTRLCPAGCLIDQAKGPLDLLGSTRRGSTMRSRLSALPYRTVLRSRRDMSGGNCSYLYSYEDEKTSVRGVSRLIRLVFAQSLRDDKVKAKHPALLQLTVATPHSRTQPATRLINKPLACSHSNTISDRTRASLFRTCSCYRTIPKLKPRPTQHSRLRCIDNGKASHRLTPPLEAMSNPPPAPASEAKPGPRPHRCNDRLEDIIQV